jgi:hypothetical protein
MICTLAAIAVMLLLGFSNKAKGGKLNNCGGIDNIVSHLPTYLARNSEIILFCTFCYIEKRIRL